VARNRSARRAKSTAAKESRGLAPAVPVKEEPLELFGTIKQIFPSTTFAVELENGRTILGHIAGRLRRHHIKLLPGDRVDLEVSPYDLTKGRIVYRYRAGESRRENG
jgi:translation initiation factor IF-1